MSKKLEQEIEKIIHNEITALNRSDIFRSPLVAYSSAHDIRYLKLKEIIGEWHLSPFDLLPDAKSIISYFVPFTKEVVHEPQRVKDGSHLWAEAYQVINIHFEHINEALSSYIISLGHSAKPIPATHTYDPKDMKCMWSHKSAAFIAGLGTFGANRLLITERGSGGRFCTVLTSAPLKVKQNPASDKCLSFSNDSCGLCHEICPVNAFHFDDIDKFSCHRELIKNRENLMENTMLKNVDICGKCISICPFAFI